MRDSGSAVNRVDGVVGLEGTERSPDVEEPLLSVTELRTEYRGGRSTVRAVNDVSLDLAAGECLGVVGESGSGKSATALSILRLIPSPPGRIVSGSVTLDGVDLLQLSEAEMRTVRGRRIGMVFQDPMSSLNPVLTVFKQVAEPIRRHLDLHGPALRSRVIELLDLVGIPSAESRLEDYPHQFSGGMRQRVMIAMALSCDPAVLIADEPTTALDVTIQAQILELLDDLRRTLRMGVLFITHDLGVVAGIADRISVMYGGSIVETGSAAQVFDSPSHPYTRGLLRSSPRIDSPLGSSLYSIPGAPPDLGQPDSGCRFRDRCDYAIDACATERPLLRPAANVDAGVLHRVACWVDLDERGELRRSLPLKDGSHE